MRCVHVCVFVGGFRQTIAIDETMPCFFSDVTKPVLQEDATGRTALHWACERGHTDAAGLLMPHGVSPCEGVTAPAPPSKAFIYGMVLFPLFSLCLVVTWFTRAWFSGMHRHKER